MNIDEVNERYAKLKKDHWNHLWDSMSEQEKIQDSNYVWYIHEMLVIGLDFAKEHKEKCTSVESIELIDITIKFYEDSLNCFKLKEGTT